MIPIPAVKPEPPKKLDPITACIAVGKISVSKCGRDTEREFVFTDADYAAAHYDRVACRIPDTALAACPRCIEVRKKEVAEDAAARK
jgi:hypothetical protein